MGRTLTMGHSVERCPFKIRKHGAHHECAAHILMLHMPVVGADSKVLTVALANADARDRLLQLLDPRTHATDDGNQDRSEG